LNAQNIKDDFKKISKLATVFFETSGKVEGVFEKGFPKNLNNLFSILRKLIFNLNDWLDSKVVQSIDVSLALLRCATSLFRRINQEIHKDLKNLTPEQIKKLNKILSELVTMGIIGVASGAIAFGAATAALPLLGFTTLGVTGGSAAAALMSTYGGVIASGSLVSVLQSAGVIGFALGPGAIIVGVGATLGLGSYGIYKLVKHVKEQKRRNS